MWNECFKKTVNHKETNLAVFIGTIIIKFLYWVTLKAFTQNRVFIRSVRGTMSGLENCKLQYSLMLEWSVGG